jgi:transposase InsO family protein
VSGVADHLIDGGAAAHAPWRLSRRRSQAGVALEPASACRGVSASVYVDNRSAFVDAWFLRAFAKRGIRMVHSTQHQS